MTQGIDYNAKTIEGAKHYMDYRTIQLRTLGYQLKENSSLSEDDKEIGVWYIFEKEGEEFIGIYILQQYRNEGRFQKYAKDYSNTSLTTSKEVVKVITLKDCNLEDYLIKKDIPHICEDFSPEYKVIERYYGDKITERSGVLLMNHINEGLIILDHIEASIHAKNAYCLHPLLQADSDLKTNFRREFHTYTKENRISSQSIILAMEYRHVANAYLSDREIDSIDDVQLSSLREVNDMLVADKIQNYKDFVKYHSNTHPRRRELFSYFQNWFEILKIEQSSERLVNIIKDI